MNESQISNNKEKIMAILKKFADTTRKPGTQEKVGLSDTVDIQVFHTQLNSMEVK
jgi:hypothetical protein